MIIKEAPGPSKALDHVMTKKTLTQFCDEVGVALAMDREGALALSAGLQKQFREALKSNMACMLPSFNHQLPSGDERGTFLALDVGGSTFRVALIELLGRSSRTGRIGILGQKSFKITPEVKQLSGEEFFEWLAAKIEDTLETMLPDSSDEELRMGLSWSFPIGQTSLRSGLIQGLGKGFVGANSLLGQCLGNTLQQACDKRKLRVKLDAIVNDSNATLLAKAYSDSNARFSLILGTGTNIAVQLPVKIFGMEKFGVRPESWHDVAENVLVNTELSAFGKGYLPMTRWDDELNAMHERPDAEPFEYLVSGRYLGEIVRLIMVEAVRDAHLFGGEMLVSLLLPYTLDTEVLSLIADSESVEESWTLFCAAYGGNDVVSDEDIVFIKTVCHHVSQRAIAVVAAGIHGLWCLRRASMDKTTLRNHDGEDDSTTIACDGSVIQSYPGFRAACESLVNRMVEESVDVPHTLHLDMTFESSLVGAAVAVACV